MKRDFSHELIDLKRQTIKDGDEVLTIASCAVNALFATFPHENIDGIEKAKRYALAMKIHAAPSDVDVTTEELAKIKDLVGHAYTPLVVGQVYDILEQKPREVDSAAK